MGKFIPSYNSRRPERSGEDFLSVFGKMILAAIAFAIAHLFVEAWTMNWFQDHYHVFADPQTPPQFERLHWQMFDSFVEEVKIALAAAFLILVFQAIAHWIFRLAIRRYAPLIAIGVGVLFCWFRWGIYFVSRRVPFKYPDSADWIIAMALGAISVTVLVRRARKSEVAA